MTTTAPSPTPSARPNHRGRFAAGGLLAVSAAALVGLAAPGAPVSPAVAPTAMSVGAAPAAQPYGPYTCKSGFVWRASYSGDSVCVTPGSRQSAADENAAAAGNRQGSGPYGPDTCKSGFVWRETRPSDHVCVVPGARDRVTGENQNSVLNIADPTGLPSGPMRVSDQKDSINCYMYGRTISPTTPYAQQWFWANYPGRGPIRAGTVTADANGNVASTQLRSQSRNGNGPTGVDVVATDTATGVVTDAGATWSYGFC